MALATSLQGQGEGRDVEERQEAVGNLQQQ
jgi:hypothetical protein